MQPGKVSYFPDGLNAKPYCGHLYAKSNGWESEYRTLIVDEARGRCTIQHNYSEVKNSHGTDVDYWSESKEYTLEQMVEILKTEYIAEDAYAYAPVIEKAAKLWAEAFSSGKRILENGFADWNWEIKTLLYASAESLVFKAADQANRSFGIKMTLVHSSCKAEADGVMKKIASISKEHHLLPILQYKWLPMDSLSDMLVMWMPLAETVGVEIEWGELRYKSIVQQSGREYMENYVSLGMDIAKALKALHDEGLVHHDVKPENFFYMENRGKVSGYLGDYDSVKPKEMQYKGRVTGTGAYMAPEVRAGKPYSYDSDIYSWGRTMFSLLEGRILKKDDNIAFKFEDDGAYLYINGSYTRSFREYINSEYYKLIRIIARTIDPEPRRRYADGSALLEALERIGVASEEEQPKNEEVTVVDPQVLVSSEAKEEKNETKKIAWVSGCYEAIEKVYEKAKENDFASKTMLELETGALAEAKAHAGMIRIVNKPITPEQYDGISDIVKESLMSALGDMGISEFRAPLTEPKIVVRLSAQIQQVRCCTAFSVLNRLEQLEASYKSLHPQAKMEIQAPLGGKKGLMQIEMLIAVLYPWLNVSEVSTNELAISESN